MGSLNVLITVLGAIFRSKPDISDVLSQSTDQIKQALRAEALSIAIRIFCGLIATSVVIYALVTLGLQLNVILLALNDGPYWSMGIFGLVAILGSVALYYLFKPNANQISIPAAQTPQKRFDFLKIVDAFLTGIEKGNHHTSAENDTAARNAMDTDYSPKPAETLS